MVGDIIADSRATSPGIRKAWLIVILLFLFMLINFADKAVIGIAAVPIMQELQLSPRQFGFVGSSFFFLLSVSAIVTGFIVEECLKKGAGGRYPPLSLEQAVTLWDWLALISVRSLPLQPLVTKSDRLRHIAAQ
jgi:hypothetical protein